ncbi:dephospho-CoA kinase [Sulfobacillus harzensis]|uniref:Dephospho-CoA kinase n=1 Tax=Sulfobacillus harzensis TaxID=2729629 RepID=A0A7Y0L3V7_9FIRM|nr:dephospho-CoA kinase [Sulfobacillus harzensis]NMP22844.1 dephospho-CoA kinase [Sulfobacillus harzensis]
MRLIGLTGGIGSGKSSVSQMLSSYGASIIDADQITHALERRGQPVWRAIFEAFGWPVLAANGELDRKKLGHWVFGTPALRARLNAIVHPAVRAEVRRQAQAAAESGAPVAVLDVPLLIEGGLYRMVDEVWVVYADPDDQAARIQARDGVGEDHAWQRIRAQMPLKDKLAYADRVIDNRGGLAELERVVKDLWQNVATGD